MSIVTDDVIDDMEHALEVWNRSPIKLIGSAIKSYIFLRKKSTRGDNSGNIASRVMAFVTCYVFFISGIYYLKFEEDTLQNKEVIVKIFYYTNTLN
jgi:Ni,Fe-hydrogenase I cytochrome b subunit